MSLKYLKSKESIDEKAERFMRKAYVSGLKSYNTIDEQILNFKNYEKKQSHYNSPEELMKRR